MFDSEISYHLADVPGLLDANTVNELNSISKTYLSSFVRSHEPGSTFEIDNVELKSQAIKSNATDEGQKRTSSSSGKPVTLRITMAFRGYAVHLSENNVTKHLVAGVDSSGYTAAIQSSDSPYLSNSYVLAAEEKKETDTLRIQDEPNNGGSSSAAIIVLLVVFISLATFAFGAIFFRKKNGRRKLACPVRFRQRKMLEHDIQSPESQNVASQVGSMFSFDDTATAGTNGLMRYITSFSRSKDSTSPSTADQSPLGTGERDNPSPDEEIGKITVEFEQEEEEHHPLSGIIPPMIVFDHIDDDENDQLDLTTPTNMKKRNPNVVPSRHIEATSSFIAALGNRARPSAPQQFENFVRYVISLMMHHEKESKFSD